MSVLRKYGLVIAVSAAVAAVLAVAYGAPALVGEQQPAPNSRPLAVVADNFFKVRVGEDAPFYGAAKGGVKPYQFEWDFGDGARSPLQNATHAYASEGSYLVRLTVTDAAGARKDVAHTVDVHPANANFTRSEDILRR